MKERKDSVNFFQRCGSIVFEDIHSFDHLFTLLFMVHTGWLMNGHIRGGRGEGTEEGDSHVLNTEKD